MGLGADAVRVFPPGFPMASPPDNPVLRTKAKGHLCPDLRLGHAAGKGEGALKHFQAKCDAVRVKEMRKKESEHFQAKCDAVRVKEMRKKESECFSVSMKG